MWEVCATHTLLCSLGEVVGASRSKVEVLGRAEVFCPTFASRQAAPGTCMASASARTASPAIVTTSPRHHLRPFAAYPTPVHLQLHLHYIRTTRRTHPPPSTWSQNSGESIPSSVAVAQAAPACLLVDKLELARVFSALEELHSQQQSERMLT
jgi:hypothetical protein